MQADAGAIADGTSARDRPAGAGDAGRGPSATTASLCLLAWAVLAVRGPAVLADVRGHGPDAVLLATQPTGVDLGLFVGGLGLAAAVLAHLAAVDVRTHRLPDALTRPLRAAMLAWLVALAAAGTITVAALGRCLVAAAALHLLYRAWRALSPGGTAVGLGDAKLATILGLLLGLRGWGHVAAGAFLGIALAGFVAALLLLTRRATRTDALPHGPCMIVGAALALLA